MPNGAEPYVDVELKDGRVLTGRKQVARGDCTDPLSEEELREKFRLTAGVVFDAQHVAELQQKIGGVTEMADVSELVALLTPASAARAARRAVGSDV